MKEMNVFKMVANGLVEWGTEVLKEVSKHPDENWDADAVTTYMKRHAAYQAKEFLGLVSATERLSKADAIADPCIPLMFPLFVTWDNCNYDILMGKVDASVFDKEDQKMARKVEPLEAVVNDINAKIKNHHIQRLQSGKCTIELGFILTDILTDFERISDHCSNIAACVCQVYDGELDTHQYLERVKNGDNQEFQQEYQRLKEVYRLPDSAK